MQKSVSDPIYSIERIISLSLGFGEKKKKWIEI